jgi:hypothetical protein
MQGMITPDNGEISIKDSEHGEVNEEEERRA